MPAASRCSVNPGREVFSALVSADLVIRGGMVIDGTGAPGFVADVAVEGGKITAIGAGVDGNRRLDAEGCVVAPGFVDLHTHYDAQLFWDPALTPSHSFRTSSGSSASCSGRSPGGTCCRLIRIRVQV